jgi:hypothetical protein
LCFGNDKDNEEATVMMADLAFRKNDYEAAMFHFQQLLQKRPDYWVALARFLHIDSSSSLTYLCSTLTAFKPSIPRFDKYKITPLILSY